MEASRTAEKELDARIRRIQRALAIAEGAHGLESKLEAAASLATTRSGERALRRGLRARRRARKHGQDDASGLPQAIVFGTAAVAMLSMAFNQPAFLWWLVFPAFGFGMAAAAHISMAARRRRQKAEEQSRVEVTIVPPRKAVESETVPSDPKIAAIAARVTRVDGICEKLLAELKTAPKVVHELIRKPEETVEALRSASHELARREKELRAAITEEGDQRLSVERTELAARAEVETDGVVKSRLAQALQSLDEQLAQRAELATSAARIEAEGTRILYSLESLRAQVLRTWAADSTSPDVAGEGLRHGLELLNKEMDAVATALEEIHTSDAAQTEAPRRPVPVPQPLGR